MMKTLKRIEGVHEKRVKKGKYIGTYESEQTAKLTADKPAD